MARDSLRLMTGSSLSRPRPLAVLFDLDGTLIDSIELILNSVHHAFGDWPGGGPSDAEWLTGVGIPLHTALRRYVSSDEEVERLIARYREYQMANHDRLIRCYDGVVDTVVALRRRGHPIGIVTSKGDDLARRGLEHVGLAEHMDTIVGCDSCTRHKPEPEPVRVALERLGYEPEDAVFVGDSVHDMASGNAAGVITIAALWGPFTRADLEPSSPKHYLDTITGLPPLLDEIGLIVAGRP